MSMLFSKIIKKIDILSEPPNLKRSKEDTYKTFTGGLFTFLVFLTSLVGVTFFGLELILKQKPSIVNAEVQFDTVGPFEISQNDINVFFSVDGASYGESIMDPRIVQVRAFLTNFEMSIDDDFGGIVWQNVTEVNIDVCSKYYNNVHQFSKNIHSIQLEYTYCLDPSQSKSIKNYWGSQYFSNLFISVEKCVNQTSDNFFNPINDNYPTNKNCYPQEVINKKFEGATMSAYISTTLIDSFNYENPSKIINKLLYFSLNNNLSQQVLLFYSEIDYYTDIGLVFTSYKKEKLFYIDKPSINYFEGQSRGNQILDLVFELKQLGNLHRRSYTKIQDVITNIGGIIKALLIIGNFVSQFFSKMQYEIDSYLQYNKILQKNILITLIIVITVKSTLIISIVKMIV